VRVRLSPAVASCLDRRIPAAAPGFRSVSRRACRRLGFVCVSAGAACAAIGALISIASCGGDDRVAGGIGGRGGGAGGKGGTSEHLCVPGMSVACACTNAAQGAQICRSDGSGYEACTCTSSQGMAGTTGAGGTAGAGGTTGAAGSVATAGTTGAAGSVATAGTTGAAGTTGVGGAGGTSGVAGTTGSAGVGGKGGTGGSATGTAGAAAGKGGGGGVAGSGGTTSTGGSGGTTSTGTGGAAAAGSGGTTSTGTGGTASAGSGGTTSTGTGGGSGTGGGGVPPGTDLIKNGNFSPGSQYWTITYGNAQIGWEGFGGQACIYNNTLGVVLYSLIFPLDPADAFAIEPGATYTFSYAAYSSDLYGINITADIRGAAAPNTVIYSYADQSDNISYKTLTHQVTYTSSATANDTADAVKAAEAAAGVVFRGRLLSSAQNCFTNVRFVKN